MVGSSQLHLTSDFGISEGRRLSVLDYVTSSTTFSVGGPTPTQASINWSDIESLFVACGAAIEETAGSLVAVELNELFSGRAGG